MRKPVLKIEPDNYRGWKLGWAKSHDGKSDWRAEKGSHSLFADSLDSLAEKVNRAERVTVRLDPPLDVLVRDRWNGSGDLKPAQLWSVCDDVAYLRLAGGGDETVFLSELRPDAGAENERVFWAGPDAADNLRQQALVAERVRELHGELAALKRAMRRVTDADVLLAAKERGVKCRKAVKK